MSSYCINELGELLCDLVDRCVFWCVGGFQTMASLAFKRALNGARFGSVQRLLRQSSGRDWVNSSSSSSIICSTNTWHNLHGDNGSGGGLVFVNHIVTDVLHSRDRNVKVRYISYGRFSHVRARAHTHTHTYIYIYIDSVRVELCGPDSCRKAGHAMRRRKLFGPCPQIRPQEKELQNPRPRPHRRR